MNELDYIFVLKALDEIPFSVGKTLLIDFLRGNDNNSSIIKNRLYLLSNFASLSYSKSEIEKMINNLISNGLIRYNSFNGKPFIKVLELTEQGRLEINDPQLYKKKVSFLFSDKKTVITEKDREEFNKYDLEGFNDEQKKAIISKSNKILCIAGAGSGKTTVLTERIKFLIKYRHVPPERILAITFTRKARQEMQSRLNNIVQIETFNSFSEKILRKHEKEIYSKNVKVLEYSDKIKIFNRALQKMNVDANEAIELYFGKRKNKTDEELMRILMNDTFFIRDYYKSINQNLPVIKGNKAYDLIFGLCNYINAFMIKHGFRDFSDQLLDTISFFESTGKIPKYDHILVDEYQDVNSTQVKLLDILNPKNLFVVGDPRQSIFGWRGSDIQYILNFDDAELVTLVKNYRSGKRIVELMNESIKSMGLFDLEATRNENGEIHLFGFDSEEEEYNFVVNKILELKSQDVFILARTNRQLQSMADTMKQYGLPFTIKSEYDEDVKRGIVLATVHAIKGMEADTVFVIGSSSLFFPIVSSEHPIIELLKVNNYDKEEEEMRLFYVAISRAKNRLFLTYSGKPTRFITPKMKSMLDEKNNNQILNKLFEWRRLTAKKKALPEFIILSDSLIMKLALENIKTLEQLKRVLPKDKIEKYGIEILSILQS